MQALILSLGYVVDILKDVKLESVPIREVPSRKASTTVRRETFKFNPERSRRNLKGSPARNCSVLVILRHPSVHHVRMPGNINALAENHQQINQKLFG